MKKINLIRGTRLVIFQNDTRWSDKGQLKVVDLFSHHRVRHQRQNENKWPLFEQTSLNQLDVLAKGRIKVFLINSVGFIYAWMTALNQQLEMKFNKASIEPDFSKSLISLIKIFSFENLVFHNLTISKGNLGDLKAINFMAVFHSLLKHSTKPLRHVINSRPMKKNNYPLRSLSLIIYV